VKIRLEVAFRKTYFWKFFLERAKRFGWYRKRTSCGVELHVVDLADEDKALEVWQCVKNWKAVTAYVDGKLVPHPKFYRLMYDVAHREQKTKWMLDQVLYKKAQERERAALERRWRMGLDGPEPQA